MLFGVLAAVAAAAQQPALSATGDPDLRCMVAMSMTLGGIEDGMVKVEDVEKSRIVALVMYYFGRIDARFPGFDYATQVTRLIQSTAYTKAIFLGNINRCGDEAERRSNASIQLGDRLKYLAPFIPGSR